jgi:hypothetical protein
MALNLSKGQKISLEKEAGTQLTQIIMGLGWDPVKKKGLFGFGGGSQEIDLDLTSKATKPMLSGSDSLNPKTALLSIPATTAPAKAMATMSKS